MRESACLTSTVPGLGGPPAACYNSRGVAGSLDDSFQPLVLIARKHKRCFVSTSRRWGVLQPPNLPPANRARCTPPMWDPFEPENLTRNVTAAPGCPPHPAQQRLLICSAPSCCEQSEQRGALKTCGQSLAVLKGWAVHRECFWSHTRHCLSSQGPCLALTSPHSSQALVKLSSRDISILLGLLPCSVGVS